MKLFILSVALAVLGLGSVHAADGPPEKVELEYESAVEFSHVVAGEFRVDHLFFADGNGQWFGPAWPENGGFPEWEVTADGRQVVEWVYQPPASRERRTFRVKVRDRREVVHQEEVEDIADRVRPLPGQW